MDYIDKSLIEPKPNRWRYLNYILAFILSFTATFIVPGFFPDSNAIAKTKDESSELRLAMPLTVRSQWSNMSNVNGRFVPGMNDTWFVYGWFGYIEPNKNDTRYSLFGFRHQGIDFAGKEGLDVIAAADGEISYANEYYGNTIIIKHQDGYETVYGHLASMNVEKGDTVKQGDVIGKLGCTGTVNPHLHFEVRRITTDGTWIINPRKLLDVDWSEVYIPDLAANRFFQGDANDPDAQEDFLWRPNNALNNWLE